MKNKFWFYLCIIEAILIVIGLFYIISQNVVTEVARADLAEFVGQFDESNNYLPDCGYIPDAKTAAVVGGGIIDSFVPGGGKVLVSTTVTYDEVNRLWKVERSYLFNRGGFVVIEQDTGKVIKALLYK